MPDKWRGQRAEVAGMIELRHPLAVLASRMPWQRLGARVSQLLSRKARAGVAIFVREGQQLGRKASRQCLK